MRLTPLPTAVLLALMTLAPPALAFDVQKGGGDPSGVPGLTVDNSGGGVSLEDDLRAQLGLANDKAAADTKGGSGLQFGGGVFSGSGATNPSSMGYDERPWIAPRARPGSN
jgi:hypothetical protein